MCRPPGIESKNESGRRWDEEVKKQKKDIIHQGAEAGEEIDLGLAGVQETNLLALIVFLLLLFLSVCPSVCPQPSQTGPGKYKQEAVLSDRKSPLVCSLAPGPGPRPFPCSPRPSISHPDPHRTLLQSLCVCICVMCAHVDWERMCRYPALGFGRMDWGGGL